MIKRCVFFPQPTSKLKKVIFCCFFEIWRPICRDIPNLDFDAKRLERCALKSWPGVLRGNLTVRSSFDQLLSKNRSTVQMCTIRRRRAYKIVGTKFWLEYFSRIFWDLASRFAPVLNNLSMNFVIYMIRSMNSATLVSKSTFVRNHNWKWRG